MAERRRSKRLLLWCANVCGCQSVSRRLAVRALRRARNRCAQLQREDGEDERENVPVEHMRAAEHHLAAVERWLAGSAPNGFDDLSLLTAELGSVGPGHEEDQEMFGERFTASNDEMLAKAFPCLAKVASMNYPGKLYMSSLRLCFHASVLGIVVMWSCPWEDVSRVRLLPQSSAKMYPVQVTLKKPVEVAGLNMQRLCLCFFDIDSLGHFDKCTNFFTGSGLFGLWQDTDDSPEEQPSPGQDGSFSAKRSRFFTRQKSGFSSPSMAQTQLENEGVLWELQRRTTMWSQEWYAPFLPHDGQKKMRWMLLTDKGYIPHPDLAPPEPTDKGAAAPSAASSPPIASVKFLGQQRPCTWQVLSDATTDSEGWEYAVDIYMDRSLWSPYHFRFAHVRRRRWQPVFGGEGEVKTREVKKLKTTLLANRGLNAAQHEIFTCDLDNVKLDALAAALEDDDWKSPGQLMALYYEEIQASDLDIQDWSSLDGVKGKTRSIECRMVVPPAPMCPKETRCNSTWHVSVSPSKVVLESVSMSLDVPYGTSFNVIVCDTFSCEGEGSGGIKMVRTCAVEWVSSIWLKNLVEENVPPQTKALGERWARVLQQWAGGK